MEPTVDERIDFLQRVKKSTDEQLLDIIWHPHRYNLPAWQMEIIQDQHSRRKMQCIDEAAEKLSRQLTRGRWDNEEEQERLTSYFREKMLRERLQREREEIQQKIKEFKETTPKTTKTKTEKEDTNMAAKDTNTTATETQNATPKIDTKAIIGFKVAELMTKAMDKGEGLPLTKMTVMQSLADGKGLNVSEIIKAKYTENFMKELDANKDIPLGKLIAFQTLQENGAMDINAMVQAKFVEKLFNDLDEKPAETATDKK